MTTKISPSPLRGADQRRITFHEWMRQPRLSPSTVLYVASVAALWARYGWRLGIASAAGLGLATLIIQAPPRVD